jgi:hypothetical protein
MITVVQLLDAGMLLISFSDTTRQFYPSSVPAPVILSASGHGLVLALFIAAPVWAASSPRRMEWQRREHQTTRTLE